MTLALIVAADNNGVIGAAGGIPWNYPEDMKYFRARTLGHAIIMGRKTFDSIGKPLPKRRNIVVTRRRDLPQEGFEVAHSVEQAICMAYMTDDAPFVIGGEQIYEAALQYASSVYLTRVVRNVAGGDTFFKDLDPLVWRVALATPVESPDLIFCTYERI